MKAFPHIDEFGRVTITVEPESEIESEMMRVMAARAKELEIGCAEFSPPLPRSPHQYDPPRHGLIVYWRHGL
jgi:hypothetical protein